MSKQDDAVLTVQPVRLGSAQKVHLMVPREEQSTTHTLCGRPLPADVVNVSTFQHDDCPRCRRAATTQGRVCQTCGEPLVREYDPGLCYDCTLRARAQHQKEQVADVAQEVLNHGTVAHVLQLLGEGHVTEAHQLAKTIELPETREEVDPNT